MADPATPILPCLSGCLESIVSVIAEGMEAENGAVSIQRLPPTGAPIE
jgi:hypothetical protein